MNLKLNSTITLVYSTQAFYEEGLLHSITFLIFKIWIFTTQ